MAKITFMGAGSSVFAKNVLGDCMCAEALRDSQFALYDIDGERLEDSRVMLETINRTVNEGRARISVHLGPEQRKDALRNADFVVDAIQVGGYEPCTVTDFDIPKAYGLRQTIADTLGIGGIMRAMRTIPVLQEFAADMEEVCPEAWFLNYVNPMSILTGFMLRYTGVKTVGLCHSVQACARQLLRGVDMADRLPCQWKVAGINHMGWLLEVSKDGEDLYPEIKRRAFAMNEEARKPGAKKHGDMVRFEIMRNFGYYITESSEHAAEYHPYFIKNGQPELVEEFNVPLDEYPRRCVDQIASWKKRREELVDNAELSHSRSHEYASGIMEAVVTDVPFEIGGNVINRGLIPNLPDEACVEVPCVCNRNGVMPCYVGPLPEQLAALNRTHINVHLVAIEAAVSRKRDTLYQAVMLDPHTRSELSLDQTRNLVDDLIEAHGDWMPEFK